MNPWTKVFILLFINILITLGIIYMLDYMQIINYNNLIKQVLRKNFGTEKKVEDPLLLEKEELNKKWELLSIKELDLSKKILLFEEKNLTLETDISRLQNDREAFINEQNLVKIKEEDATAYNLKIKDVAIQIASMPPSTAAELLNLQDDLQVVDILKAIDVLATQTGQASTVPFLLTLLERTKAARVQTLILTAISP